MGVQLCSDLSVPCRSAAEALGTGVLTGSKSVSWCLQPSQPQRIISGLRENFIKRYIVKRTRNAEIRLEEQSEKAESCRELFKKKKRNTVERATKTEIDTKMK